jgi:tetratricopeptide (TPR) repeat protein
MKTTLNLVDQLLARGRNFQELGRLHDAQDLLTRLAGFRELPAAAAEETQARLAELHLKRKQYGRARRCLAAALAHNPNDAHYHHLMAVAHQADDRGDLRRADKHFRKSLQLNPKPSPRLSEAGLLAVRLGRVEQGLALLRQAVAAAPDDVDALRALVKGLRLGARPAEARAAIRAGLFRNSRDPRFRRLWDEYRFRRLRRRQQREGRAPEVDVPPVLLPFCRPAATVADASTRLDGPATVAPPHKPRTTRRADHRSVQ